MNIQTLFVCIFCFVINSPGAEFLGGWVIGWGNNTGGETTGLYPYALSTNKAEMLAQFKNPQLWGATGTVAVAGQMISGVTAVSCGGSCPLALKSDGSVVSWGIRASQAALPANLTGVVAIAAGEMHNLALKKDGTVVAWGENRYGATSVPEGLSEVVAIAVSGNNSLALRKDGTLVGWGENIKLPPGLSNVVAISACPQMSLGIGRPGSALVLQRDGTVINIEWDDHTVQTHTHADLSNVVAIAAGPVHNLALKQDGTVAAWGFNDNGELNVPIGLTNIVAVAASGSGFPAVGYSLALKADGQVVAWGEMNSHSATVPTGLSNVVAISASRNFCLAITTNSAIAERFRQK